MPTTTSNVPLEGTVSDPPRAVRILGREPAAWVALIEAGLFLALAVLANRLPDFDAAGFMVVAMALVSALFGGWTAIATTDDKLGWITGLVKAVINLLLFFSFDLSPDLQAALLGFVAIAIGFLQRSQTSPVVDPVDPSPTQVVASPVTVDGLDRAEDVQERVDAEVAAYRASSADSKADAAYHGRTGDPGC